MAEFQLYNWPDQGVKDKREPMYKGDFKLSSRLDWDEKQRKHFRVITNKTIINW